MTDAVELPNVEVTTTRLAPPQRRYAERLPELHAAMADMLDGFQSGIQTALPCILESFDPATQTCRAKPAIKARALVGQQWESLELPLLVDVPVAFPGGGGFALTFPLAAGDEVLVVFASRCLDSWWQSGDVQEPAAIRAHSLSDGMAIPGIRSKPRALAGFYTDGVEIRSDDGAQHIRATGGGWQVLGNVAIIGNLAVTGEVVAEGDVTGEETSLHTHVHGGVQTGISNTGVPAA